MAIESWMVSVVIAMAGVVLGYGVNAYVTKENKQGIEKQWRRLDEHYKRILSIEGSLTTKPDMEKIRKTFVEIKMWELQNEHISDKFNVVNDNIKTLEEHVIDKVDEVLRKIKKD